MGEQRTYNKRQMLKGAGVVAALVGLGTGGGYVAWDALSGPERPPAVEAPQTPGPASLERLAASVVSGGPGKDGIPSIDEPKFVKADQADFLDDDEPVFGLAHKDGFRAYPQQVLVWHEIVNDRVDGRALAVTYCPLTGTAIAFTGPPDGAQLTFGTTGSLVNSNLVMYDRETDSTWPQLTGVAITGERKGQKLGTRPLQWTTWGEWRTAHPGTEVLSTDTGHLRDYGTDPYGSYTGDSGYYQEGGPVFPVLARDAKARFADKDVVVGVRVGDQRTAVDKERIEREGRVRFEAGGATVVAEWDERLGTARVTADGKPAEAFDAMWFAWYAFHPDTEVLR